jgi:hypothetical protein
MERMPIYVEIAVGLGKRGYCGRTGDILLSTVPPRLDGKERNRAGHGISGNMTQAIKLELEISFRRRY